MKLSGNRAAAPKGKGKEKEVEGENLPHVKAQVINPFEVAVQKGGGEEDFGFCS